MAKPIIEVENLSKLYRLGVIGVTTLRDSVERWWYRMRGKEEMSRKIGAKNLMITPDDPQAGPEPNTIWALRDVSFSVKQGEIIGIIGRNGAGKTTLLKILSRITEPTSGRAIIRGRTSSMLEVGTGFHRELTGRENIYLNGAILGMRKAEIDCKFDEIVAFAELEKFIDTPVKRYSSGMYVRLAFAVCAHLEPEILLVDEVLAVGDIAFQKKCLGKMGDVAKEGRTVLFVSHNMAAIQSLTTQTIVLNRGRKDFDGETKFAIDYYLESIYSRLTKQDLLNRKDRIGDGRAIITDFWLEDKSGKVVESAVTGEDTIFCFKCKCFESVSNIEFAFSVHTQMAQPLFRCSTRSTGFEIDSLAGETIIRCRIRNLPLIPGRYTIGLLLSLGEDIVDYVGGAGEFYVSEGDFFGTGVIDKHSPFLIKHEWELREN